MEAHRYKSRLQKYVPEKATPGMTPALTAQVNWVIVFVTSSRVPSEHRNFHGR
jgi:hypothetical protein